MLQQPASHHLGADFTTSDALRSGSQQLRLRLTTPSVGVQGSAACTYRTWGPWHITRLPATRCTSCTVGAWGKTKHQHSRRLACMSTNPDAAFGNSSDPSKNGGQSRSPEPGSRDGYDPKLAAGFQAPPGEPQLWWVEKYEQRRKELASRSRSRSRASTDTHSDTSPPSPAALPAAASSTSHTLHSQGPAENDSSNDSMSHTLHSQGPATNDSSNDSKANAVPPVRPGPRAWLAAAVQAVQLTTVLWMLIGFPASLQPGGLYAARIWLLLAVYWVFFALGGVRRQLKYGSLASRQRDKQTSSWGSRARLLLFIASIVLLHWGCILRLKSLYYLAADTWYEVLGAPTIACALWLHDKATQQLGQAYDRVVAPEQLVTTGVYAHLQHPIYTSYMLLFCGYALLLHSAPLAFMFLLVCLLHYSHRTQLEAQVLATKFGDKHLAYAAKTRMFVPLLY